MLARIQEINAKPDTHSMTLDATGQTLYRSCSGSGWCVTDRGGFYDFKGDRKASGISVLDVGALCSAFDEQQGPGACAKLLKSE